MLVDYHVHTPYCGHAHGKIIQYIEAAIKRGISEIGFSDHLGRYYLSTIQKRRYWDWGMGERDLARYHSEISDLQDVFANQIKIKIGLEIDFIEGAEEILQRIISQYPFDFFIGSIHCLPRLGWKHISDYKTCNQLPFYSEYFRLANAAIESKLFNTLAHLDFIWRYIEWPEDKTAEIFAQISKTIENATKTGSCIEVNANGFMWSKENRIHGTNPFDHLLNEIKHFNTKITLGSDAHEPIMVGKAFPGIISTLHEKEIRTVQCFTDGKPYSAELG